MKVQNIKMNIVQYTKLHHKGMSYRNTSIGLACAEEYACVEAAYLLLNDKDGHPLPDDVAIFGDRLVTDCDTRGSIKFIGLQNEIIGSAADCVAEHIPDIGHVIKYVSNGFYKLKEKNKELSGVGLLDVSHIKAISADVSRHLRAYNIVHKSISNSNESYELKHDQMEVVKTFVLTELIQ